MKYRGVIFDFNGTLFWDTEYHNQAWDEYLHQYNIKMSNKEKSKYIYGRTNKDIFEFLFKKKLNYSELKKHIEDKEKIYRDICLNSKMELAPGAVDFLDFCKHSKIKIAIATSSELENVKFFIEKFNLSQWFDIKKIVYDDFKIKGKPNPDIYLIAARKLKLEPGECVVIEDSMSGIEAARSAKIGKIYYIKSNSSNIKSINEEMIYSFDEINKEIFC